MFCFSYSNSLFFVFGRSDKRPKQDSTAEETPKNSSSSNETSTKPKIFQKASTKQPQSEDQAGQSQKTGSRINFYFLKLNQKNNYRNRIKRNSRRNKKGKFLAVKEPNIKCPQSSGIIWNQKPYYQRPDPHNIQSILKRRS